MRTLIHAALTHTVEVAFESIQVSGPEPAELSQPGIHLLKWFRFQSVETALCVHRGFHETGIAQHAQVLGHGRLRHTKLTLDLSHRLLGRNQEAQYRTAVRLRNDFEHRFHSLSIRHRAYTCQGIFSGDFVGPSCHVRGEYDYCDFEVDTTRAGPRRPEPMGYSEPTLRCITLTGRLAAA